MVLKVDYIYPKLTIPKGYKNFLYDTKKPPKNFGGKLLFRSRIFNS